MAKLINIIAEEVRKFNESIKSSLQTKNINNTREASDSLIDISGVDFVESQGVFYLEFLDTGRGPGKFPPIEPIQNWVKIKLGISDEDESKQVAFLIARKIAALGTEIFRDNGKGIELTKKVEKLNQDIEKVVGENITFDLEQKLNKFKKKYEFSLT